MYFLGGLLALQIGTKPHAFDLINIVSPFYNIIFISINLYILPHSETKSTLYKTP